MEQKCHIALFQEGKSVFVEFYTEDLDNEKFQHGLCLRGGDTLGKEKFSLSTLYNLYIIIFFPKQHIFFSTLGRK